MITAVSNRPVLNEEGNIRLGGKNWSCSNHRVGTFRNIHLADPADSLAWGCIILLISNLRLLLGMAPGIDDSLTRSMKISRLDPYFLFGR